MADENPRSSPVKKLLIGVTLLLVLAGAALVFLPIKNCPACAGSGSVRVVKTITKGCPWCNGSGKIPFVKDLKNAAPILGE